MQQKDLDSGCGDNRRGEEVRIFPFSTVGIGVMMGVMMILFSRWASTFSFTNFMKFQQNALIRKTEKAHQKNIFTFQKSIKKHR